jgi:hypothetical protein
MPALATSSTLTQQLSALETVPDSYLVVSPELVVSPAQVQQFNTHVQALLASSKRQRFFEMGVLYGQGLAGLFR